MKACVPAAVPWESTVDGTADGSAVAEKIGQGNH